MEAEATGSKQEMPPSSADQSHDAFLFVLLMLFIFYFVKTVILIVQI